MKRWILLTTLGWFIGILLVVVLAMLGELLYEVLFKVKNEEGSQLAVGIGMGAGVGWMQWLAIRKYLASAQKIFWFTLAGFTLAFMLMDLTPFILGYLNLDFTGKAEIVIPFTVLLAALISGWLQFKYIFQTTLDDARNWLFHYAAGWLLATFVTIGVPLLNFKTGPHFPKILIAVLALSFLSVGGPVLGYITGRFIVPRINKHISDAQNSN